jgi:hypothetical protein
LRRGEIGVGGGRSGISMSGSKGEVLVLIVGLYGCLFCLMRGDERGVRGSELGLICCVERCKSVDVHVRMEKMEVSGDVDVM